MSKMQVPIFADDDDLPRILRAVNEKVSFQVVRHDVDKEGLTIFEVRDLGRDLLSCRLASQAQGPTYLLVRPGNEPRTRVVEQRGGGVRRILDQQSHPESVVLRPGGRIDGSIIAGQIGTISSDPWSIGLYREVFRALRRQFEKIKSYYVGPAAARHLDEGGRLTTDVRAPAEYDLWR